MIRRWLRRLAAVLGGLGGGLLLAEAIARVSAGDSVETFLWSGAQPPPKGMFRPSLSLMSEPTPGFTGTLSSLGFDVPVRINEFGLRGGAPGGGPYWLAVGDSFTMALQVREEDTFEVGLGPLIHAEVLNGGVNTYATWQSTQRYREVADKVDVDGVILVYFLGNDLLDNARQVGGLGKPLPAEALHPRPTKRPDWSILDRDSFLYAYVQVALRRRELRADPKAAQVLRDQFAIHTPAGRAVLDKLLIVSALALTQIRDEAESRGDRLVVAVAPAVHTVDPAMLDLLTAELAVGEVDVDAPRLGLLAVTARLGIATCDLTPPLAAAVADGRKPYLRFDGHWSSAGHAVVAETLAGCIGK